jgi:hypothetical protein
LIDSDDGTSSRPAQKGPFHEDVDDAPRGILVEAPQARRLRQRQLKSWHFDEFIPDALHEPVKIHGSSLSNIRAIPANQRCGRECGTISLG